MTNQKTVGLVVAPGVTERLAENLIQEMPKMLSTHYDHQQEWIFDLVTDPLTGFAESVDEIFEKVSKDLEKSNIKELKYEWIWEKTQATGHLNSKKMPMKAHENILVFYEKLPFYNPQKTQGHERKVSSAKNRASCIDRRNIKEDYLYGKEYSDKVDTYDSTERFPRDVLKYATDKQKKALHPTQKPVALLEYFLKTYTKESDWVLDFTSGSGSLGEACLNTNRNCILIKKYDE